MKISVCCCLVLFFFFVCVCVRAYVLSDVFVCVCVAVGLCVSECVCVVSGVCVCDTIGLCACVCVIYGCVYNVLLECCVRAQKIGKEAVTSTVDSFVLVPFVDSTVFVAHFCFIPSAHLVTSSAALQMESCFSD